MVSEIFEQITATITAFASAVSTSVTSVISMFWDSTGNQLTTLGVLLIIAVGTGLVFWAFKLIKGLISRA